MNQPSPGTQDGANASGMAPEAQIGNRAGTQQQHQTVLGPFTVRDLTVFGSTAILFFASLLPMFGGRYNLWNLNNLFFLGLGIILPLVVTALFVARRLQPASVIRIGSLSIDQFASVVASFAVALFFLTTAGVFTASVLLGLLGALGLFTATVLAPHLPYVSADFKDRAESPAHVVARNSAVPFRKPATPKTHPDKAGTPAPDFWRTAPADLEPAAGSFTQVAGPGAPPTSGFPAAAGAEPFPATQSAAVVPPAGAPEQHEDEGPAAHAAAAHAAEAPAEHAEASAEHAEESAEQRPAVKAADAAPYADAHLAAGADATGDSQDTAFAGTPRRSAEAMPPTMASPAVAAPASARRASFDATVDPLSRPEEAENPSAYEAFWFAVPQPRTAVDEHTGAPVFTVEPGGWVLALEDRGDEFLVQHTDGRVGLLRDLSHIERG